MEPSGKVNTIFPLDWSLDLDLVRKHLTCSPLTWVLQHKFQLSHTLHLHDDFLVINHPNDDVDRCMAIITMVFNRLHLPIAPHKTVGPRHALEYLGITLDTIAMEARLPVNKLERLRNMIEKFVGQSSCTKRQLFQLSGHLNFTTIWT